jgi:hypothetical protein
MPLLILLLILVGGPVLLVQYVTGMPIGFAAATAAVLAGLGIYASSRAAKKRRAERRIALTAKYGSPDEQQF